MSFSWDEFLSLPVRDRGRFVKICDEHQEYIDSEIKKAKPKTR